MTENDRLVSAGHDYDGIQEYDNPSPRWWTMMLYMAIVFSAWYLAYYLGKGAAIRSEGAAENMRAWSLTLLDYKSVLAEAELARNPVEELTEEELGAFVKNPQSAASGKKLFLQNCASCHAENGQGLIGPNLTDDHWIHGWKPQEIVKSISEGYPEKGMVAWKPMLGARKVRELAAFVISIEGNEVPNPKAPEGTKKE